MESLRTYGWDDELADAFAAHGEGDAEPGRIVEEQRGMYRVVTGGGEVRAEIAGRLLRDKGESLPAVGDWVAVRHREGGESAVVRAVLPRRSQISRKVAGRTAREQVLAANVDTVFMVTSCNEDFSPRRIERYLIMIWESGANPVVLLHKSDLVEDPSAFVAAAEKVALGVPVHLTCATREDGLAPIAPHLRPRETVALLGSSGVGKSTIVNRLMGEEVQEVREVIEEDSRGRHTTRSRQLFLLPGGALVLDTPGLRELALWITDSGLGQAFADIEELAEGCRFADCIHDSEPGCAVKAEVEAGRLPADRLESYHQLRRELRHLQLRADGESRADERRRWRIIQKNVRAARKKGWLRDD
jgi:ribosome biogenesis GTPase